MLMVEFEPKDVLAVSNKPAEEDDRYEDAQSRYK